MHLKSELRNTGNKVKDVVSPIVGDFKSFLSVPEGTNKHTQEKQKGCRNLNSRFGHIDTKQNPNNRKDTQYFPRYTWHICQNRLHDKP